MEAEKLLDEFASQGTTRGGEFYLPREITVPFARRADELGVAIIGAEAAILEDSGTIPQSHLILDLSSVHSPEWETYRRECNRESEMFLAALPERLRLYVSFVLIGRTEWFQGHIAEQ